MCDINTPIDANSIVVYKCVERGISIDYISPFARASISVGRVSVDDHQSYVSRIGSRHANSNMKGRVSGFKDLEDAQILAENSDWIILKIELHAAEGIPIMEGTAKYIADHIPAHKTTFAGPIVASIEEVTSSD